MGSSLEGASGRSTEVIAGQIMLSSIRQRLCGCKLLGEANTPSSGFMGDKFRTNLDANTTSLGRREYEMLEFGPRTVVSARGRLEYLVLTVSRDPLTRRHQPDYHHSDCSMPLDPSSSYPG